MKVGSIEHNNINFGFNCNTHRKLAQKVIEDEFPRLRNYLPVIKKAVVAPDFEERGFHSNTHFYFPVESIFKPRESFLDFDAGHNARAQFNLHIDNFYERLKYFRFNEMADEAGRAKHFLDDMSVGLHVKRGNFLDKLSEGKIHLSYEEFIFRHEDEFIKKSSKTPVNFETEDFDDIFMSVVNYSKNSEMPAADNVKRWSEIAQNSINLALDASRVFFKKISDLMFIN